MTTESGLDASFIAPVPEAFSPLKWTIQVSITFPPLMSGFEYGAVTPTALSPASVYVARATTLEPSDVPLHDPAAQTCVHFETTESDPAILDVPFHVPETSASVTAGAIAGAASGAGAIAAVVSAGGVSVFAHAIKAKTAGIKFNVLRMTSPEKGEEWASLHWRL
jgi:hypothetical protein